MTEYITSFIDTIKDIGKSIVDGFYRTPHFSFIVIDNHVTFLKLWSLEYLASDTEIKDEDLFDKFRENSWDIFSDQADLDELEKLDAAFVLYYDGIYGKQESLARDTKSNRKRYERVSKKYREYIRRHHMPAVLLALIDYGHIELLKIFPFDDIDKDDLRESMASFVNDIDTAKFLLKENILDYEDLSLNREDHYDIIKFLIGTGIDKEILLRPIVKHNYYNLLPFFTEQEIKNIPSTYYLYIHGYTKRPNKNILYKYLLT